MTKMYRVDFFTGTVGADGRGGLISDALRELSGEERCPVITLNGLQYEIRDLRTHSAGRSYSGVFTKYRLEDLPHAGAPGEEERELDLAEDEGLLEKNFFLFYRQHQLLVFQRNRNGCTATRLAEYLSDYLNETSEFDPVLQPEPMRRLLNGNVQARSLNLSFARPDNPDFFPENNWSNRLFGILADAGGVRMNVRITSDARSRDDNRHYLSGRIKRALTELADMDEVTVVRAKVEEDGIEYPIDLIADRLVSEQTVAMEGRYPVPDEMLRALRAAKNEVNAQLEEIFGG